MSWFFLALIATFFWALTIILDDNMLRNVYRTPHFGAAVSGILGGLPAISLLWVAWPTFNVAATAMLAGILVMAYMYFYFRAFENIQPSEVSALMNLIPAFVPFLAFFILGETLSRNQYVGLAVVVNASFLISAIDIKKFQFSKTLYLMAGGSLLYALAEVLAKLAYQESEFGGVYGFVSLGMGLAGLFYVFAFASGKNFFKIFLSYKPKIMGLLVFAEILAVIALFFHNRALDDGPVAAIAATEATLPALVLGLALVFYPFWPKYFREATAKGIYKKIILMFVMAAGLHLIYS